MNAQQKSTIAKTIGDSNFAVTVMLRLDLKPLAPLDITRRRRTSQRAGAQRRISVKPLAWHAERVMLTPLEQHRTAHEPEFKISKIETVEFLPTGDLCTKLSQCIVG
ncbi:hypothetical protein KIN20_013873 [Parelaphostrongylus tenuis]|uniref:Uncharacterized protein n=1 Tax=Parelaphostrongylus tenuis TaxID=148309 RepID=A0AAD5N2J6_PARTN|nr:hypothetical protein KIN20_013873 [Parelaphostrongylus tenuis]